jgi:hypothetical protein
VPFAFIAAGTCAAIAAFTPWRAEVVAVELVVVLDLLEPQPAAARTTSTGISQTPSLLMGTSYVDVVV